MPLPHPSPRSLRYLKARLRILQRPQVWGTAAGLTLAITFVSNYWLHPNRFTLNSPPSVKGSNPSAQADAVRRPSPIDTNMLPALPSGLTPEDNSTASNRSKPNAASGTVNPNASAALPALEVPPTVKGSERADRNSAPIVPEASPSLFGRLGQDNARSGQSSDQPPQDFARLGNTPIGTSSSDPIAPAHPLQTAIDRYAPAANAPANSPANAPTLGTSFDREPPIAPSNIQPDAITAPIYPGQTSGQAAFSPSRINQTPSSYLPQTSPPLGTTGYTLPPSLINPAAAAPQNSPSLFSAPQRIPFQSGTGGGGTSSYPTSPNPPQPIQPQPAPATPQSFPGRPIGNGQINTFSNPSAQ